MQIPSSRSLTTTSPHTESLPLNYIQIVTLTFVPTGATMKSRTAHVWHVALLSALLVLSLASFSVTAAFMQYLRDYGFIVSVPYCK